MPTDTMATADFRKGDYASAAERSEQAAALFEELGAHRRAAESLELAAEAWGKARNEQRATITWQFTVDDARRKLHRIYPS